MDSQTPDLFLLLLLAVGVIGIVAIFHAWRRKNIKNSKGITTNRLRDAAAGSSPKVSPAAQGLGSGILLGRALILVATIAALAGIILVTLPQSSVEAMVGRLEARRGVTGHEKIALLYLGDDFADGAYRIRGVVRNITATPPAHPETIGQMDAIVRLYDRNRTLLEAVIVRLDKDAIEPNDFARLNLTVPAHTESFAGYAVEFKLREGDTVPYKDLRDEYKALHSRPQQPSNP